MNSGVLVGEDVFLHPDDIKGIHEIHGFQIPGWVRVPSSVHEAMRPRSLLATGSSTLFLLLENHLLLMIRAPPHNQFVPIDSSASNFKIASSDGDTLFSLTLDEFIGVFAAGRSSLSRARFLGLPAAGP